MASKNIKGITVEIGGNTTGLDKALKGVESSSKKATSELKEVDRALKNAPDSAVLWKQKQDLLTKALEESKKKLELLETAQEQVSKQFQNSEIDEGQYRAFQREVENAKSEVGYFERQLADLDKTADDTADEVQDLGEKTEDAGDKAESSSDGFTVMKGALAQLAADGVKKVAEALKNCTEEAMVFEDSVAKWSTIADGTVSTEKFKDQILELSNATGIAADELANTAYDAISAGQSTADAVEFVSNATNLARAGFAETSETLDLLTTILNAYGLESEKVTEVSDILIQTQNLGKTTVAQLSSAMGKVIPTANAAGVSLDQLAAGYAIMTANGVATAETTTYINSMLNELSKSGTTASDVLKDKAGKSFQELVAEGESLGDILAKIKEAADEQNLSMSDMFGSAEAAKAGLILLGDGAESFNSTLSQMKDSAGATEEALGKLDTTSYSLQKAQNELKNTMISVGSEALKQITPIIQKWLPKLQSGLEKFGDKLPELIDDGKKMIPVITGIGSAVATWKIASVAAKGAEAVKKLSTAVSAGDSVMKALNITMNLNPAVAVTTAIIALTAATVAFIATQKEENDIAKKVAEQYAEEYEKVQNLRDEITGMKDDFQKRASEIDAEADRTEYLWKELDKLADATGRVTDADKTRAEYLLGELSDALGTEYTMTGNQIDNYRQLSAEIDTVIAKKKAEAYLDDYLAMASTMGQSKAESLAAYEDASVKWNQAQAEIDEAATEYRQRFGTDISYASQDRSEWEARGAEELYDKYHNAIETANNASALMQQNKAIYLEAVEYYNKLDKAEKAYAEGRFDTIDDILYAKKDADKEMLESATNYNEKCETAYKNLLTKTTADLKLALEANNQAEVDSAFETMGECVEAAKIAGIDSKDIFTEEFIDGIKKMVDNGFDISGLTDWGKDSGASVADVFCDEYYDVVQRQLDKGYNVTSLLEWGAASGYDVSKLFTDEFTKKFQSSLDLGFDTSGLISWAIEKGYNLGDVFGSNFQKRMSQYVYDNYDIIPQNVNSPSDAAKKQIGLYATGGFISSGNKGIVAEAGPELLEVMNGGVKVTPLSQNARNTAINGQTGQKIFYNNYTIKIDNVSSSYDVQRIAYELAAEQKRIEAGRGE